MHLSLTHAVPPEVPQEVVFPASKDIDVPAIGAAGMLEAITWRPATLGELGPQARTPPTHIRHPQLSFSEKQQEQISMTMKLRKFYYVMAQPRHSKCRENVYSQTKMTIFNLYLLIN